MKGVENALRDNNISEEFDESDRGTRSASIAHIAPAQPRH